MISKAKNTATGFLARMKKGRADAAKRRASTVKANCEFNPSIVVQQKAKSDKWQVVANGRVLFTGVQRAAERYALRLARKRPSNNPGVVRFSESEAKRYSSRIRGLGSSKRKPSRKAKAPRKAKGGGLFGRKKGVKRFKRQRLFSGSGLLGLGRSTRRISRNGRAAVTRVTAKSPLGFRTGNRAGRARQQLTKRPRRRNETPQGVQAIHEKFLGRPSQKSFTVAAPRGTPADVAVLGKLVQLKSETETFNFGPGEAHLGADPDGRMYVLGHIRVEPHHDFGELVEVSYLATKVHLDNKPTEYFHKFREGGGIPPKLTTDAEGAFHIVGGTYTIEAAGITR